MSDADLDDETLMAFADGELDPAAAAAIAAHRDTDAALAARIRMFEDTARLARRALDPIAHEPVPLRLLAAAQAARPARHRFISSRPLQALAACLLLAVGLGAGYLVGHERRGGAADGLAGLSACGDGTLSRALETAASGERRAVDKCVVVAIASYRDDDGIVCREFQASLGVDPRRSLVAGIACRDEGGGWRARVAIDLTAPGRAPDSYSPASGPRADDGLAPLRAVLGVKAAPLSSADEDRLRQNGWRTGS